MVKFFPVLIAIVLASGTASAAAQNQLSISANGWTVTADGEHEVITVSYTNLGEVIQNVGLNLQSEHGLLPLKRWTIEKRSDTSFSVITAQPQVVWLFELDANILKVSSTFTNAVLTAEAPAPKDRIIARLIDPQGVPVIWRGTNAIEDGWAGKETRNPSFLPSRNPECIYFALGQVSGSNFHSLFDRGSDIAISFSDTTVMRRNRQDQNLLDVTIPIPGNTLIRLIPEYFTKTLGVPFYVPFDNSNLSTAPEVWGSWTGYYDDVTEQDMVRNADWIAKNLKDRGFQYVLLDDGYDRGKHDEHQWIGKWNEEKFPHGPKWLAQYIKSKGLNPGLWIVPNAYAGATDEHPDWYLRDKQGKYIMDYNTPVFDSTNPEVLAFLKHLFTVLDDDGFNYYKFDGEFNFLKYDPAVDREKLYDKTIDPDVVYRNRLKAIRETVGPKVLLEGSPEGAPLDGMGYFDTYWNGYDNYNAWPGMGHMLSSISDNVFLNHIVTYLIPGEGVDVSPQISLEEAKKRMPPTFIKYALARKAHEQVVGESLAEAHTLTSYLSLTGVVYSVADIMPDLPKERVNLLKETLPTMPIFPIDLFSRGTDINYLTFQSTTPDLLIQNYPEILDLKVNAKSGVYDVVALSNWRAAEDTRTLSFADKLGLDADCRYIVFDFWNQKLLGVFKDKMKVDVASHDTRVLSIHRDLNQPQLIGDSRHITGAYSILDLEWNKSKDTLRGSSQTVPGEDYTLWIYLPSGTTVSQVQAMEGDNHPIAVRHTLDGNSLKVSFQSQSEIVHWAVEFRAAPR